MGKRRFVGGGEIYGRKNGDHIVVESAKVGSARRSGQIVEVLQGSAGQRYRVQWEDGHQTEFFPGPDAMVVPPASFS
ncbi:MAG: DUF1918 domain-containing protein [Acidimicrobiales bacterium]|jgi:hypothetical protein